MIENFGTLGLFLAVAFIFPLLLIGLPLVLRYSGAIPRNPTRTKQEIYECGMKPFREAWTQFNFHYYMFAILFVVLDVMSVFLFPWAAKFVGLETRTDQIWALVSVVVFVGILLIGFLYAWKKKALEWK
ncbi:MAG: NADH-quinone oxidoreductase subunit A [Chloroflexi bacterium]|nr:NADH-quinone oxidoreductase subunit A [Chloroflexota bacterium]